MVHDPRVATVMSRLGGLYRDPSRVDRDASMLLRTPIGLHLKPGIAPLVENNGNTTNCLVLQGTIAMAYRGQTYQQLVDIYLPSGYPRRPPVTFVRLAPHMYLKANHRHVGNDGMLYMPYLHEWSARTHNLVEMVIAMSSVFSADPPVFSKPPEPERPNPPPAAAQPPPSYSEDITPVSDKSSSESDRFLQEQIQAILAKEAEEANRAAEVARQAAHDEEEKKKRAMVEKAEEEGRVRRLKQKLNDKLAKHFAQMSQETKAQLESDWRDNFRLEESKEAVQEELEYFRKVKSELEEQSQVLEDKTKEIQEWLEEAKTSSHAQKVHVDDLCKPSTKLYSQMLELSAENAALTDALYFLDRAMYMGQMDCTTHLKAVRKLAKKQFLVRAHLIKINQTLMNAGGR